jgi:7-cyano-7-deazaguanine reductase
MAEEVKEFRYLGKRVTQPSRELDTFPKPEDVALVKFTSNELTSFCPVTGQPDFYTVTIEYEPRSLCVESKSLKLYLWSFREEHLFAEALASQIAHDIISATNAHRCRVELVQNIRGGLQLTAVAEVVGD